MKYGLCVVLLGAVAAGAIGLVRRSAQTVSKPVVENFIFVDTAPPPRTARELARDSEAVVIAMYTGKARVINASGPMETLYTFEVQETIKPSSRLATDTFEISIPGGEKDVGDHIERTSVEVRLP